MRSRTTLVALAVFALLVGFATTAVAEEEPVTLLKLDPVAAPEVPECDADPVQAPELTLADLSDPVATSTCNVYDVWIDESCTCNGYIRQRLYQQVCCPWGCSGLLVTSSTRCTPHACFP